MRRLTAVVAGVLIAGVVPSFGAGPAQAQVAQTSIVSAVPAAGTPNATDGRVFAITQVGSTVVMGGSFTSVTSRGATIAQPYVLAFDATTGAVNMGFMPKLDKQVETLLPGPGNTVYVGGDFTTLGGVAKNKGLLLLNLSDGTKVPGFTFPAVNGTVQRVRLSGSRLFVGGTFTTVGGQHHGGLVAVNPTTGAVDASVQTDVTDRHSASNPNSLPAAVGIFNFAITPAGDRLIAVGNFVHVDGLTRDQIVMLDLTTNPVSVRSDWRVQGYQPICGNDDTYVRDVDFSPDGTFLAVAAVGGAHAGTWCDAATRFETGATGDNIQPTWIDYSGGDSLLSVAVTGSVVYVGGHQRWLNNPSGHDTAAQGAVPRPGLGALDPDTGVPLSWNPGRNPRGAGTYALYATPAGLWIGSDTNYIGNRQYKRGKIAFFPIAGGTGIPPAAVPGLAGNKVYIGGQGNSSSAFVRAFDGTTTGADSPASTPIDWSAVRGAFVVDNTLYYGQSDSTFHKRAISNGTFGADVPIDPYNDPLWSTVLSGSGTAPNNTYRGLVNDLYGKFNSVTSMFYDNKRIYFTLKKDNHLYYKAFSSESAIIGATRVTVPNVTMPAVSGAFLAGGSLYYALASNGSLQKVAWVNGAPSGSATTVSSANWSANALFIGPVPAPPNPNPTAAFTTTCTNLHCVVDASASHDNDGGSISTYAWTFGDTGTGSGVSTSHDYAAANTYTISLTVTDNDGHTDNVSHAVTVTAPPTSAIAFRAKGSTNTNSAAPSVTVPASAASGDALVLIATSGTATTQTAPAGWTVVTSQTAGTVLTTIWQRVATGADAGTSVTVTLDATTKVSLQVLDYSGTRSTNPVTAATTVADNTTTATHRTPDVTVPDAGSWVVWYWADKSSSTTAWTAPAGTTVRDQSIGLNTGRITSLIADLNGPSDAGTVAGRTATTDQAGSRAIMASIVLASA